MRNLFILIVLITVTAGAGLIEKPANLAGPVIDHAEDLIFLYEEEKVAMDVYNHFESIYGITPFVHISDSEQRHFDQMEALLLQLGLIEENAVIREEAGIFRDAALQEMYNDFIVRGEQSLIDALKVSAFIEEHDILGLETLAAITDSEPVKQTMLQLASASKNHLRAFVRNLEKRDVEYQPELLDKEYFNNIIKATHSCCQPGSKNSGKKKQCQGKKTEQ